MGSQAGRFWLTAALAGPGALTSTARQNTYISIAGGFCAISAERLSSDTSKDV